MDWTEGDVVVTGVRLHYARAGSGSVVLLLHGVTDSGRCWGRTADALARSHDTILLDQRGHGESAAPESGYALADLAGDVAGAIRVLGLASASVVGHSLGARAGLTLAATYPDLVTRLVLIDPPLDVDWSSPEHPEWDADTARYQWFAWARDCRALSREALVDRCRSRSPAWSADECARWAESKLQLSPRLWGPGGIEIAGSWREELARVRCPTLLVRGDVALGAIVDDAHAAEAARLLTGGADVRIEGAGHSIHRDQLDACLAAIRPFLDGTED